MIAFVIHGNAAKVVIVALILMLASLSIGLVYLLENLAKTAPARRYERKYGSGPWSEYL